MYNAFASRIEWRNHRLTQIHPYLLYRLILIWAIIMTYEQIKPIVNLPMLAFIASGHICWHEHFSIFCDPQCEILLFLRCPYGRTIAWYKVLHKCILYHSSTHFYSRWSLDATITVPALWYMYAVPFSGSQSTRRMASFMLHLSNYRVYNSNAITNAIQIYTVL